MFRVSRPAPFEIAEQIEVAGQAPVCPRILDRTSGLIGQLPRGLAYDYTRSRIGLGAQAFAAAKQAFAHWTMFDLGWVRVANPQTQISPGQIVAVEVRSLGLCSLNLSRIVEVIDDPAQFGFIYATTELHVEYGEERFLLKFNPATEEVWYEVEAISRPQSLLARIGFPIARAFQHKFARDSHRRMREAVQAMDQASTTPQNG